MILSTTFLSLLHVLLFLPGSQGHPYHLTPRSDPDHETWHTLPTLTQSRQEHSVVSVGHRIYVLGGIISNRTYLPTDPPIDPVALFSSISPTASMQYFDLTSQKWYDAAPLPMPINHANVASIGGKIYVLGGLSGTNLASWNAVAESFVYDPKFDHWRSITPMPEGTARGASAIGVHGNDVWLAGGMIQLELEDDFTQASVTTVTSYNVVEDVWRTDIAAIPSARDHVAGAVFGNTFIVTGGRQDGQHNWHNDTWALSLDYLELGWSEKAPMPTARGGLAYASDENVLYTFGGEGDQRDPVNEVFPDVQSYDFQSDSWMILDPMPLPKHGVGFVPLVDGKVYIPGGGVRISAGPTDQFDVFKGCGVHR